MKVLIASEGAGYALKEAVKAHLIQAGHEIVDVGMTEGNPVSYPAAGAAIAKALQQGVAKKAIAICGSVTIQNCIFFLKDSCSRAINI